MNSRHFILLMALTLSGVACYLVTLQLKHGKPDSNNIESRIIIENNSTQHIEEGDVLVVEEIVGGTIILVPKDQSNLVN
jgi:hypothetical protein